MSEVAEKPVPVPNEDTRVLFEGAERGELMIQHCLGCGEYRFVARKRCDLCASPESEWVAARGRGRVITYAWVHQRYHPGFYDELPYNIAVVELDEGPRFITNVVDLEGRELHGGMPVEVVFERRGDVSIPVFRPVR